MWRKLKAFPQKHPLLLSLILGVVGNLVWSIVQIGLNKVDFFEAFWQVPKIVFNFIIDLLTVNIPIWGALLTVIILIALLWIYAKVAEKPQNVAPHERYTTDFYKAQKYKWEWWDNTLAELRPICNECDGELASDCRYGYHLICPNCDKQYQKPDAAMLNLASTYFVNKANKTLKNPNKQ